MREINLKKISLIIFISLIVFCTNFCSVFAIKASIHIDGNHIIKDKEDLTSISNTFILESDKGTPMPSDSDGNIKKISVSANEGFDFGEIDFPGPGTYTYKVYRDLIPSERLEEDDSVYNIIVRVFDDNTTAVIFQKEHNKEKSDGIVYRDVYLFKLNFDLEGGTLDRSKKDITKYYEKGSIVILPEAPKKDGFEFDYWKGSKYKAGAKYEVTGDHDFTAIYKEKDNSGGVVVKPDKNDNDNGGNNNSNSGNGNEGDGSRRVYASGINSSSYPPDSSVNMQTGDRLHLIYILLIFIISCIVITVSTTKRFSDKKD